MFTRLRDRLGRIWGALNRGLDAMADATSFLVVRDGRLLHYSRPPWVMMPDMFGIVPAGPRWIITDLGPVFRTTDGLPVVVVIVDVDASGDPIPGSERPLTVQMTWLGTGHA